MQKFKTKEHFFCVYYDEKKIKLWWYVGTLINLV